MARRRKWRTTIQHQESSAPSQSAVIRTGTSATAIHLTELPVSDLRRVSIILLFLLAILGGIVYLMHSGSNTQVVSKYLGRMLHVES
jgi:hypothetical protein